jgi:putative ABC transport system permease protein
MPPAVIETVVRLALRNLRLNPRRSLLTVTAVAMGLAAMTLLWGFNHGLHANMIGNFQDAIVGSLQVHREGFFRRPHLDRSMDRPDEVERALAEAGVERMTRRLELYTLAAGPDSSSGMLLMGVQPKAERAVTRLAERVTRGRFLAAEDTYTLVMGAASARNLRVDVGDEVALISHDRFGMISAERFTLVGIVTSGEMGLDRGLALAPLASVQEWLEMEDQATSVVARVPEAELDRVRDAVDRRLNAGVPPAGPPRYEVMRWHDMFSVMREWVLLDTGFHYVFLGVVLFIVVLGVLNTVLVSTLERTRELGMLMAVGTPRGRVALLVLVEAGVLGLVGTLLGVLLGVAGVLILGRIGVDLSPLLGDTGRFYVDPVIRPSLHLGHLAVTAGALLLACLAAAFYPAWRASRLEPAQALRHV